jgi:hypothetical protein
MVKLQAVITAGLFTLLATELGILELDWTIIYVKMATRSPIHITMGRAMISQDLENTIQQR